MPELDPSLLDPELDIGTLCEGGTITERILLPDAPAVFDVVLALAQLRQLQQQIERQRRASGRLLPNADPWILAEDALRFSELFAQLDGWLSRGGEWPPDWNVSV